MDTTASGWRILDPGLPALWREYSFGPGMASTLVVGFGPGKLLVVSPASGLDSSVHDALKPHGDVVALLAPNAYHHLGIESWLARWPNAAPYAAVESLPRLMRKCSAGAAFRPLSQLALPEGVFIDNPAGLKTSDLVLRARLGEGWLWYINDLVMNLRALPTQAFIRLVFTLTGAKTGLSVQGLAKMLLVREAKATGQWLLSELDARPPSLVVFGHGDPLGGADIAERLKAQIRARY